MAPEPRNPASQGGSMSFLNRYRKLVMIVSAVIAVLLLLVLLGPSLLSTGPGTRFILGKVNRDLDGTFTVDDLSLGWFTGVRVRGGRFADSQGAELLAFDTLTSNAGLLGLARGNLDFGDVIIDHPVVTLTTGETAEPSPDVAKPDEPTGPSAIETLLHLRGNIKITNGEVHVIGPPSVPELHLTDVNAAVAIASPTEPITSSLSMTLRSGSSQGTFSLNGTLSNLDGVLLRNEMPGAAYRLEASQLDLAPLAALAGTLGVELRWRGTLNSTMDLALQDGQLELKGRTDLTNFALFDGPLGQDRLDLGTVEIPHDLLLGANRIDIRDLQLNTALAQVQIHGAAAAGQHGWLRLEEYEALDLTGTLNMEAARIAMMLPNTLKLRKGLKLLDGKVKATVTGKQGPAELKVMATLTRLRAQLDGTQIALPEDVTLNGTFRSEGKELVVPSLTFHSGFADITGSGTAEAFSLTGRIDLAKLTEQLRSFVELGQTDLAGTATIQLKSTGQLHESLDLDLVTDVQDLKVTGLFEKPLIQQRATLITSARLETLNAPEVWPKRLTLIQGKAPTATDKLTLTTDNLSLVARDLTLVLNGPTLPELQRFDIVASGDLGKAYDDLAPLLDLPADFKISGKEVLTLSGGLKGEILQVDRLVSTSENLVVTLPGTPARHFNHAKVVIEGSANWDRRTGSLDVPELTLNAQPFQMKTKNLTLTDPTGPDRDIRAESFVVSGQTADLAAFSRDFGPLLGLDEKTRLTGAGNIVCTGHVKDGTVHVDKLVVVGKPLVLAREGSDAPPFRLEQVSLDANGSWSWPDKSINIGQVNLNSSLGTANVSRGRISDYGTDKMALSVDAFDVSAAQQLSALTPYLKLPEGTKLSGSPSIRCKGSVSGTTVTFTQLQTTCRDLLLTLSKSGKQLRQKNLSAQGTGKLNWRTRDIDLSNMVIVGDFGKATVSDLLVRDLGTEKLTLRARVTSEAELAVLQRSFGDFLGLGRGTAYAGALKLDVTVQTTPDGRISAAANAPIRNFRVKSPGDLPEIREALVNLTTRLDYDVKKHTLKLNQLKLTSTILGLDAIGAISDCGKTWTAEKFLGTLDYDVAKLRVVLGQWLPPDMQLTGRKRGPFVLNAPLPLAGTDFKTFMKKLKFTSRVAFDWLATKGIEVTGFDNKVIAKDGKVRIDDLATTVNGGRAVGAFYIDFRTPKPILKMGKTNIQMKKMKINETLANEVLKYVNPIFTGSHARGRVTIECFKLQVPLTENAIKTAAIHARVQVDDLDMEVRGLLADIITVFSKRTMRVRGKIAPFDLYVGNGKVSYTGLAVNLGDFDLVFSGSVGLDDESVDLEVSIPLTDKLLGNAGGDIRKLLEGQRVTLPITGTIKNTRLATEKLLEQVTKLLQEAMRRLLLPFGD